MKIFARKELNTADREQQLRGASIMCGAILSVVIYVWMSKNDLYPRSHPQPLAAGVPFFFIQALIGLVGATHVFRPGRSHILLWLFVSVPTLGAVYTLIAYSIPVRTSFQDFGGDRCVCISWEDHGAQGVGTILLIPMKGYGPLFYKGNGRYVDSFPRCVKSADGKVTLHYQVAKQNYARDLDELLSEIK